MTVVSYIHFTALYYIMFFLGGENKSDSFNSVERYCCSSDSWTEQPCMKQKRAAAGATVCDGKIYVAGERGREPL